jgi:hypothetical protein
MYQFFFIAALFLIVLLALNFEFLLLPNPTVVGLGGFCVLVGLGIIVYAAIKKRKSAPQEVLSQKDKKSLRSAGCVPTVTGSLYVLTGVGVLILQAIGFFH